MSSAPSSVPPTPASRMLDQFRRVDVSPEVKKTSDELRDKFIAFASEAARLTPPGPEQTVMLRKLLEAKDCAIRALLFT